MAHFQHFPGIRARGAYLRDFRVHKVPALPGRLKVRLVQNRFSGDGRIAWRAAVPKGRFESSPGRQSWVGLGNETSPAGTAEPPFNRPSANKRPLATIRAWPTGCDNRHSMRGLLFLLVALLGVSGCGYHTLGSAAHLPDTVHTLAVPIFKNKTQFYHTEIPNDAGGCPRVHGSHPPHRLG